MIACRTRIVDYSSPIGSETIVTTYRTDAARMVRSERRKLSINRTCRKRRGRIPLAVFVVVRRRRGVEFENGLPPVSFDTKRQKTKSYRARDTVPLPRLPTSDIDCSNAETFRHYIVPSTDYERKKNRSILPA